jgi:hypothetical protein
VLACTNQWENNEETYTKTTQDTKNDVGQRQSGKGTTGWMNGQVQTDTPAQANQLPNQSTAQPTNQYISQPIDQRNIHPTKTKYTHMTSTHPLPDPAMNDLAKRLNQHFHSQINTHNTPAGTNSHKTKKNNPSPKQHAQPQPLTRTLRDDGNDDDSVAQRHLLAASAAPPPPAAMAAHEACQSWVDFGDTVKTDLSVDGRQRPGKNKLSSQHKASKGHAKGIIVCEQGQKECL